MTISKEVKTAVLVILGLLLIVFTFNFLKGENLLDSSRKFYALYDNVEGLGTSSPVTINGLIVGKVQNITLSDESAKLKVTLLVDNDYAFSKNSTAQLYETGLIGGKAVAIVPAFDGAVEAKSGDQLNSSVKAGLLQTLNLNSLQTKIESMVESADSVLTNLNTVFDAQTKANLQQSISDLSATISSFKHTSNNLNGLIADNEEKLDSTLTNFHSISKNLDGIVASIEEADLGKTITNLESILEGFDSMLTSIENGEGTMGKLVKDDELYNNLESATKELEELLRDIKLHPKRYFRILSKKEIPYEDN